MMQNWPVITAGHRLRRSVGLCRGADWIESTHGHPAAAVRAIQNGYVSYRGAGFLRLTDQSILQRHGPWRSFVDAGVLKMFFVQDGDRDQTSGDNTVRVRGDFDNRRCAQLVRIAVLRR